LHQHGFTEINVRFSIKRRLQFSATSSRGTEEEQEGGGGFSFFFCSYYYHYYANISVGWRKMSGNVVVGGACKATPRIIQRGDEAII